MATSTPSAVGSQMWAEDAACAGMGWEDFFSTDASAGIQVCSGCPVLVECLQFALLHQIDTGIWGGLTPRHRTRLRLAERVTSTHVATS